MLDCWLTSYISNDVLKHISSFNKVRDAWTRLEKSYVSKSRAKAIRVRKELQGLRKGTSTISKYMLSVKMLAGELETASSSLIDEQKLMKFLGDLDESHDNVISTFIERMLNETVTLDDAKALFLSHECFLAKRKAVKISHLPTTNINQVRLLRVETLK